MRTLNLYSPEAPTPRQFDAIKALLTAWKKERGIEGPIKVLTNNWGGNRQPVLVLGSVGPEGTWVGFEFQHTYSAKQFETKANAATVFNAALDNYFGEVVGLPSDVQTRVYGTYEFVESYINPRFDLSQPIAVDVETGGVLGQTVTPRTAPLICIAFAQGGRSVSLDLNPANNEPDEMAEKLEWLQEFLPKIEKPIWHNGKFDITVIESNTGIRMPNWFDTMLAHHVLNQAAREHGLKALCRRYFNAPDWEAGIKQWIKGKSMDYSVIPYSTLGKYNCYDVLWTYRLWQKLSVELEADDRAQMAYYLEMQTAEFLVDVEAVGIPFAEKQANKLRAQYLTQAVTAELKLRTLTGDRKFNPGSPQQVKRWLEGQLGYPLGTTNEEAIDAIKAESTDELVVDFCEGLIEYRKAKKMLSTYLAAWEQASNIEGDSRVHPTFHVHGTTTGRLSSSDPNAQNVPRDKMIRKMVTLDGDNNLKL